MLEKFLQITTGFLILASMFLGALMFLWFSYKEITSEEKTKNKLLIAAMIFSAVFFLSYSIYAVIIMIKQYS